MATTRRQKVLFSKTDIMSAIGGLPRELDYLLSDNIKSQLDFKKGRQSFKDAEVFLIYKDLFPLKSDSEIKEMIRY